MTTAEDWRTGALAAIAVLVALTLFPGAATSFRPDLPSPATGWLIVSGASGAGASCAVTRADNVATGAAFVHDSCANRASAGEVPPASVRDVLSALLARVEAPWMPGEKRVMHTWRWVVSDHESLVGDLPWLDSSGIGAKDAAAGLLRAIEARLTDSCAPPLPPPSLVLVTTLPRMINPVSADASQELIVRYRAARERWALLPTCAVQPVR